MTAADFEGVSKTYSVYPSPGHRLKELITLNRRSFHSDFWALRDLTFEIFRGETFCIIGENGSGKSTLLQLIAGILHASSGVLTVRGRVAALLELGAGFNPEFSGRDNVYLNGAILGFSKREMDRKYRAIQAFAEIGDFIDQPVRTYSSGMLVRLAFAVAIHVEPEILLVDEALAVGDSYFRQRCLRKVDELRSRGATIVFVSHSMADVKAIGDRTLWLENGRIRSLGDTGPVVADYLAAMAEKDAAYLRLGRPSTPAARVLPEAHAVQTIPNIDHRYGDGRAEIIGIAVLDAESRPIHLMEAGSRIIVRISARANAPVATPAVGFVLRNHLGIDFAGTDTNRERHSLPPLLPGEVTTIDFHFDLPELYPANFSFSPSITDGTHVCDCIDNAVTVQMGHSARRVYGYIHLPTTVQIDSRLSPALEAARG